jgi:hypothetical protein
MKNVSLTDLKGLTWVTGYPGGYITYFIESVIVKSVDDYEFKIVETYKLENETNGRWFNMYWNKEELFENLYKLGLKSYIPLDYQITIEDRTDVFELE